MFKKVEDIINDIERAIVKIENDENLSCIDRRLWLEKYYYLLKIAEKQKNSKDDYKSDIDYKNYRKEIDIDDILE